MLLVFPLRMATNRYNKDYKWRRIKSQEHYCLFYCGKPQQNNIAMDE